MALCGLVVGSMIAVVWVLYRYCQANLNSPVPACTNLWVIAGAYVITQLLAWRCLLKSLIGRLLNMILMLVFNSLQVSNK